MMTKMMIIDPQRLTVSQTQKTPGSREACIIELAERVRGGEELRQRTYLFVSRFPIVNSKFRSGKKKMTTCPEKAKNEDAEVQTKKGVTSMHRQ
jgi:hypothetical protein